MADNTNPNTDTANWQLRAHALQVQQKWSDVISLSSAVIPALKADEEKAIAYFMRGFAYKYKGNYNLAIADYSKAIELKPDYAVAYNNRGRVYEDKGEYDLAIADYNKAIELKPDFAAAYNNRGSVYNEKGEYDRAIADFNKAIELDPCYAEAYNNRGYAYNQKGERDRAIADFNKAIELDPDYAMAYSNRGYTYHHKGEIDRAIADFNKAIELKPDLAIAYNNRGLAYHAQDKHDDAIADYDRAIALDSNYAVAYNNRGLAYHVQGKHDDAIADYNRAIALNSDYAVAYSNRGHAYAAKGEHEKALADWERAIKLAPRQNPAMIDNLLAGIKAAAKMSEQVSQFSKKFDSGLRMAKGFERREKMHRLMHILAGLLTATLLGALFAFYAVAFGALAYRFGIINYFPESLAFWVRGEKATSDASVILPWIPVILLTSSPIIWAVRIANRAATRHFTLHENAYANWLMTLMLPIEPRDKHQEELFKKLFDHHSLRGSPQLVVDLENKPKTDDGIVWQVLNLVRRNGGKSGGNS